MEDVIVVDSGPRMSVFVIALLGVVFAAFCIWLTVRIVNRRERWAKRTAIALAAALFYPLSWGPALWLQYRGYLPESVTPALAAFFWPLEWFSINGPQQMRGLVAWFGRLWLP
jgi:hypothetical protein